MSDSVYSIMSTPNNFILLLDARLFFTEVFTAVQLVKILPAFIKTECSLNVYGLVSVISNTYLFSLYAFYLTTFFNSHVFLHLFVVVRGCVYIHM